MAFEELVKQRYSVRKYDSRPIEPEKMAKILSGIVLADSRGKHTEKASIGYMPQKNYAFRMSTKANILLGGKDEARANDLMDAIQSAIWKTSGQINSPAVRQRAWR